MRSSMSGATSIRACQATPAEALLLSLPAVCPADIGGILWLLLWGLPLIGLAAEEFEAIRAAVCTGRTAQGASKRN